MEKHLNPLCLSAFFAMCFILFSCKKNGQIDIPSQYLNSITYPDTLFFSKNILSYPGDTTTLNPQINYEMGARLGILDSLKITITNLSDTTQYVTINPVDKTKNIYVYQPIWSFTYQAGFVASRYLTTYQPNVVNQIFYSTQPEKISLTIRFDTIPNKKALCRVDIYEGVKTLTKTKYYKWHN